MHRDDLVRMADSSVLMHRITRDEARELLALVDGADDRVRDAQRLLEANAADLASDLRRTAGALTALAASLDN